MTSAYLRVGTRRYLLDRPVTLVGRDEGVDIRLDAPNVSGRHALLIRTGGACLIYDFKSANGVTVNGQKIAGPVPLQHGQVIGVGRFKLEFLEDDPDPLPAPAGPRGSSPEPRPEDRAGSTLRGVTGAELLKRSIEKDVYTLIEERPAEEDLVSKLLILFKVSSIVNSIVDTDALLRQIVELATGVMSADRAILMLAGPEGKLRTTLYRVKGQAGAPDRTGAGEISANGTDEDQDGLSFSHSIAESCFLSGESVFTNDAQSDARFVAARSIQLQSIRSAMCVPLAFRSSRRGVLYTDNRLTSGSFTPSDFLLLKAFAEQAAIAIENSLLLAEVKASLAKIQGQQEMLIQAEKMSAMGHLAAGLAHEIRNPLTAIAGYVEMYFRRFQPGAPFHEEMCVLESAVGQMHHIVDGLLGFARKGPRVMERGSVNHVVEETLLLGRPALSEHRTVRIRKELAADLPDVWMDQRQVQQVFLNLIMNAVQAMPDGGTLTIRTRAALPAAPAGREDRPRIVVEFHDTGIGIPAEHRQEIFQPFCTLGKKGGTGLGLTISKSIIEGHGGSIAFGSEPGRGTTFSVVLPVEGRPRAS